MATIVSTSVSIYAGITDSGTQVGNTITVQGSPANVTINSSTLGVALQPGHQYCAVASCVNSDNYTASTQPYAFKTLILAEIVNIRGANATVSPTMSFTYDNNVISVNSCGVYLSTTAGGSNPVRYTASDEQEAGQGWTITGLTENTTYYAVPYVVDDLGREYIGDWADAETINSGYANPSVTITNTATTYNSISGTFSVSSNDTLSSVYIEVLQTGGQDRYIINKNTTTGSQSFTITDGDYDDSSTPQEIHINQNTEYRVTVYATNSHGGGRGFDQATVTTQQQATSTIAITSISNITPVSAVVNISYGSTQNQTPAE